MKISAFHGDGDATDRFLKIVRNGQTISAVLDGEEVKRCFVADEDEGYVIRAVLDKHGRIQTEPNNPEEICTEKVFGDVSIKIYDRQDA